MNRQASSVLKLAAAALLVSVAAIGCAKHDSGAGIQAAPTQQAQEAQAAPATQPVVAPVTTPVPAETAQPDATAGPADGSAAPVTAGNPVATADPVDTSISNLDQLIKGIENSLNTSDSGGGE